MEEEVETSIYPLAVKIEPAPEDGKSGSSSTNAQITKASHIREGERCKRIALSEPRDTIVMSCRQMCICSKCAKRGKDKTTMSFWSKETGNIDVKGRGDANDMKVWRRVGD
ncbi:Uncharacterized protein Rs2_31741 [Raphanus sativus]|nr:Uncharacterized protein Rs2_31741 [Raphanus sativus]